MKKNSYTIFFYFVSFFILQSCSFHKQAKNIKVLSIKKVVQKNIPGYELCNSFALGNKEIVQYFTLAEQVDGYEFHSEAIILPCKYQGTIVINGDLFQWEINAGGAGYLYNDKINENYLCSKKCSESSLNHNFSVAR